MDINGIHIKIAKNMLSFDTLSILKKIVASYTNYDILSKENALLLGWHRGRGNRNIEFAFPKNIRIKASTVGLIVGEGHLGERKFIWANSSTQIITSVLEFLKQFNIEYKTVLELCTKANHEEKKLIEKSERFWAEKTGLVIGSIRLRPEFFNTTKHGTLHISCNNTFLAKVIKEIIISAKKVVEKTEILASDYIKGILAGEGNVNIRKKTKCLIMVRISAKEEVERKHYKHCLNKTGIRLYSKDMKTISKEEGKRRGWKTDKGRAGAVLINRWENFVKMLLLNMFELSKEKENRFMKGFLENKFTKIFLDFKKFEKMAFSKKDMQKVIQAKSPPSDRIKTGIKNGFLIKIRESCASRKESALYKLTPKYFTVLNKISEQSPIF